VVPGDEGDRDGTGGEKGFGGGAAGERVEGISEPEKLGGAVIGDEGGERGGEFGIAPRREEIAAGAVARGVTPVEVGDHEQARAA
jgi:hypothetical protein